MAFESFGILLWRQWQQRCPSDVGRTRRASQLIPIVSFSEFRGEIKPFGLSKVE